MDIIREVLRRADKHARLDGDRDGNIPIMNAIESLNTNICQELLKENADQQMKTTKVCLGATRVSISRVSSISSCTIANPQVP